MANEIPIEEIHILWLNAGLSCDGDTIAMTAATQPSIEDLVFGALRCQIQIEVTRRRYTAEEQEGLRDLFGEPERWGKTLRNL